MMTGNHIAWFVLSLTLKPFVALRTNDGWAKISPDNDPDSYRDALDAFRLVALPQLNAARAQCDLEVAIEWSQILVGLLFVESSDTAFRLTLNSVLEARLQELVVTFDKTGERWSSSPRPCDLASSGVDVAIPVLEEDRFVQMSLITLTETTEAKCALAERFVPLGVLDAVMVEGTRNEEVELHVLGPAGPHRVHFEFSGAKPRLISSDVPVCDLARSPRNDSSVMQMWGGLSLSKARPKRIRRIANEISKKARTRRFPEVPNIGARLPKYTGQLESEFHWPEAAPECFGYGPEVQDQGSCGACWAFATLGALSDRHCLAHGKSAMSWPDGGLKRFSVQDFLSCHHGEKDGCKGGSVEDGVKALMEKRFSFERESPYFSKCYLSGLYADVMNDDRGDVNCSEYSHLPDDPANNKPCTCWGARPQDHPTCNENIPRQNVQVGWGSIQAFGYLSLPKRVELIMRYIREGGPVATSFDVWDDFKPLIARAPDVPYYRHDVNATWRGGHGVIITGWGVSTEGVPYWWARNSWGTNWGKRGYFKIARGSNSVGFENHIAFAVVKEEFTDPTLQARQGAESSYATFGIRLPWSNDMVPHWGKIVKEETSADHVLRFVPSGVEVGPVIARFDTANARYKKDIFTNGGTLGSWANVAGQFQLLMVEIPFECSEPCTIWSSEMYQTVNQIGELRYTLRPFDVKLDDDSWSRGVFTLYFRKDDPYQGKSNVEIDVHIESGLLKQIAIQMKNEGLNIFRIKDWHKIPKRSSHYKIPIPTIPLHQAPDLLPEPILPLELSLATHPVNCPYGKYLKLTLDATEPSVFTVRVSDKHTSEQLLSWVVKDPPSLWAWLHIGGVSSIGGVQFKHFFYPGGRGYGRDLSIEVEAVCDNFVKPVTAFAKANFKWPQSNSTVARFIFPMGLAGKGKIF